MGLQEKIRLGYDFTIDPKMNHADAVDVIICTADGQRYYSNFITPSFVYHIFDKNERTGECCSGTYFTMPNIVIVRKIDRAMIKRTIDQLAKDKEIDEYFSQLE